MFKKFLYKNIRTITQLMKKKLKGAVGKWILEN